MKNSVLHTRSTHISRRRRFGLFMFCIAVCFFAAAIGSFITAPSIDTWYTYLNKPFYNPPNWIFGPVWTVLYAMMGYALFLALSSKKNNGNKSNSEIHWFALQLILNTLWSIVFFGLHLPGIAFILIIFLWISILVTIREFFTIINLAGILLVPYLCWVTFAGILNASIVILN